VDRVETVVVGAGVVGLAVARQLAAAGHEVVVLEAAETIGTVTSSRNSEVIHAGIYYPQNSLMARLCVRGREALYAYCRDHGVAHRNCGKLIVATTDDDRARLTAIRTRAAANGVRLDLLDKADAMRLEPALSCTGALVSPATGIIDSHAYMLALRGDAENAGAAFAFRAPLERVRVAADGFILEVGGAEPTTLATATLVNAAGLSAPNVARTIDAMPHDRIPTAYFAKGNYFSCTARAPFSHLIYPVPEPGGLGVHLTLDMAGQARFGPDVEWIETIDYTVDPARAQKFYPAIRRYWPDLPDGALTPAYAGIRPKIVPPAIAVQDFAIQTAHEHGLAGLINLFGIESPGLTASLALADLVGETLRRQ
jgi:L-2-hydroxyglutarate oxidase LhgO